MSKSNSKMEMEDDMVRWGESEVTSSFRNTSAMCDPTRRDFLGIDILDIDLLDMDKIHTTMTYTTAATTPVLSPAPATPHTDRTCR